MPCHTVCTVVPRPGGVPPSLGQCARVSQSPVTYLFFFHLRSAGGQVQVPVVPRTDSGSDHPYSRSSDIRGLSGRCPQRLSFNFNLKSRSRRSAIKKKEVHPCLVARPPCPCPCPYPIHVLVLPLSSADSWTLDSGQLYTRGDGWDDNTVIR
jgi:hypothetical protein